MLFGDYAPTGKLPVTWTRSADQQPINDGDGRPAFPVRVRPHLHHDPAGPGAPTGLTASAVTATSATLSWTAATGGTAPLSYRVARAGTVLATVTGHLAR